MKRLVLIVLLVAACNPASNVGDSPSGSEVYFWHDDQHGVSCWLYGGGANYGKAISCLPDVQVRAQ